jgi:hypothetical protein
MTTGRYRPAHQQQHLRLNGSLYGCTDTSTAMFIDAATVGGAKITEAGVRKLSSEPIPDPASPGLNIPQAVAVAWKLRVSMIDKSGETWGDLITYLDQGRYILLQHDMYYLRDGCGGGGHVGHAMLLQTRRRLKSAGGAMRIFGNNPMCPNQKWYNPDYIKQAAEAFGKQTGVANGGLRFAISRIVPKIEVP